MTDKTYSTTRLITEERPVVAINKEDALDSFLFLPTNAKREGEGGLRTKGCFKQSYQNQPLITVVTVVYNGEEYLEKTIESVIHQSYDNVEYIIVDGASSDGTLDIIKKYEEQIDYWVSERDGGIYDAMNRAASLATGDWINFMNVGDKFHNGEVLVSLFESTKIGDSSVVYGDVVNIFDANHQVLWRSNPVASIYKGIPFSHQSTFAKTDLMRQFGFDMRYKISADYNFLYILYIKGYKFYPSNIIVADYDMNGFSTNYLAAFEERKEIVSNLEPSKIAFYSRRRFAWLKLKAKIKALLPPKIVIFIRSILAKFRLNNRKRKIVS